MNLLINTRTTIRKSIRNVPILHILIVERHLKETILSQQAKNRSLPSLISFRQQKNISAPAVAPYSFYFERGGHASSLLCAIVTYLIMSVINILYVIPAKEMCDSRLLNLVSKCIQVLGEV